MNCAGAMLSTRLLLRTTHVRSSRHPRRLNSPDRLQGRDWFPAIGLTKEPSRFSRLGKPAAAGLRIENDSIPADFEDSASSGDQFDFLPCHFLDFGRDPLGFRKVVSLGTVFDLDRHAGTMHRWWDGARWGSRSTPQERPHRSEALIDEGDRAVAYGTVTLSW